MGSTLTTYQALLKERYIGSDMVEKLVYPENTLLTMLEKRGDTGMVGDVMPVPVFYGNPQGVGGAFATAQTNATNTKSVAWAIQAGDYYGVVHIGDKVMMASRTNQGAFLENKMVEIDQLYVTAGDSFSAYIWGNGGGSIGRRESATGNVVRLTDPAQSANFELDLVVVASPDDGSVSTHALRVGSDAIEGVDRDLGDITFDNVADITSFADLDWLFRQSDFFGDTGTIVFKGVQSFITAGSTSATVQDLWGVTQATRLTDIQRFTGCRVNSADIAGKSYEERLKILFARMTGRYKAKAPTAIFLHPEDWQVLETLMGARGVRPLEDKNTKFGFMKIDMMTGSGAVPTFQDRHCPRGHAFCLRMEDWWISSMGELLHPQTSDGLEILRRATSTDLEFRLISYPLLACRAPKNSGRVPLT